MREKLRPYFVNRINGYSFVFISLCAVVLVFDILHSFHDFSNQGGLKEVTGGRRRPLICFWYV